MGYKEVDAADTFTISFYKSQYRQALNICGSLSGRDVSKEAKAGLTPCYIDGTTAFEEADMIMICKKMYHDLMPVENFDAKENDAKWYADKDYHSIYIAEIQKILVKS